MSTPVSAMQYLLDQIAEQRQNYVTFLAKGSVSEIAEYKRICGFVQGLDFASNTIQDLAKRMERSEEDE